MRAFGSFCCCCCCYSPLVSLSVCVSCLHGSVADTACTHQLRHSDAAIASHDHCLRRPGGGRSNSKCHNFVRLTYCCWFWRNNTGMNLCNCNLLVVLCCQAVCGQQISWGGGLTPWALVNSAHASCTQALMSLLVSVDEIVSKLKKYLEYSAKILHTVYKDAIWRSSTGKVLVI